MKIGVSLSGQFSMPTAAGLERLGAEVVLVRKPEATKRNRRLVFPVESPGHFSSWLGADDS